MPTQEQIKAAMKIHERVRYLRGRFLNFIAVIERDIALILTDYFCTSDPEKRELFFKNIVTASYFSLSVKKDVLVKIVKKDYPKYWEEHSQTLKALNEIMEFRNKLAHSVVDVSDEALTRPLEEGVGLIDWKAGKPITDKEFEEWEVKTNMISGCLNDIKQLLPFKEKPKPKK